MTIIIPSIVAVRWREACAAQAMDQWSSLHEMILDQWLLGTIYAPESPLLDDLHTLAAVARQHVLDMQPEEVAA